MWGENMPTTCAKSSKNMMKYQKIGKFFSGLDLEWNCATNINDRTCRLNIKGYIERVLLQNNHKRPTKPQLFPHKHRKIHYRSKIQVAPSEVDSPSLETKGIKRFQTIVGALLLYG